MIGGAHPREAAFPEITLPVLVKLSWRLKWEGRGVKYMYHKFLKFSKRRWRGWVLSICYKIMFCTCNASYFHHQEALASLRAETDARVTSLQQRHDDVIAELRRSFDAQQEQVEETHRIALQVRKHRERTRSCKLYRTRSCKPPGVA